MIELRMKSWNKFAAAVDEAKLRRWLQTVAQEAERAFKKMRRFPPASRTNQYPAIRTGRLRASIRSEIRGRSVIIGSNMYYSSFLRSGTIHMDRRKMSDNALEEGIQAAKTRAGKWVGWSRLAGKLGNI
jgi:phage gpG-like protein